MALVFALLIIFSTLPELTDFFLLKKTTLFTFSSIHFFVFCRTKLTAFSFLILTIGMFIRLSKISILERFK